jgi:hypothetical protein
VSGIGKFTHKPTVIEAVRWTGDNLGEVYELAGCERFRPVDDKGRPGDDPEIAAEVYDRLHSTWIGVKTGQWVAKGTKGELWPIDDEVFRTTYDPAETPIAEEFAVFWGGSGPDDCAGFDITDDAASAEEDVQWRVAGGVARREVSYGPWVVTLPPESPEGSGCACYRGPYQHAHDSDEDGDCLVCGCGRYEEPEPKEDGQ